MTASTLNLFWYHEVHFFIFSSRILLQNVQQIECHKKIANFFAKSSCLPELGLEKLSSVIHTFSKLRVGHGKIKKYAQESAKVLTQMAFLKSPLPNTLLQKKKNTAEDHILHWQITKDCTSSCHGSDSIYSKHWFLSCNLLCPPPHPLSMFST